MSTSFALDIIWKSIPWKSIWISAIAFIIILAMRTTQRIFWGPLSHIPGPLISRITNLELKWHTLKGRKMYYLDSLHQRYGAIVRISPDETSVVDLTATREIHKITGGYRKTSWYQAFTNYGNDNMFTMIDVKEHSARRRLLGQPLSETALTSVHPLVFEKVSFTISQLKKEVKEHGYMDVLKWFHYMSADIIGDLSFGESFGMLESGKDNQYIQDMNKNGAFSSSVAELSLVFKLLSFFPLPIIREMRETPLRLLSHAQAALDKYKNILATKPETIEGKPMLFSKLFKAQADGGLTDGQIGAEAASNIVGGGETVAIVLTYLIWAVSHRPDIQDRIGKELQNVPEAFIYDDVKSIRYLEGVLNEAHRLYGTVTGASLRRTVPDGGRTLAGYFVPEGTTVATLQYTLHRDPKIFENPLAFRPERWERPSQAMKDALLPYGLGTRSCVGLHLANIELRVAIVSFFRAFPHIVTSSSEGMSDEDMEMVNFFLISPKGHRCLIGIP